MQNKDDDEGEISSQKEDELKPKIDLSIEGTDGDDKILDGTGANKIDGGEGNDTLDGGEGIDKLTVVLVQILLSVTNLIQ